METARRIEQAISFLKSSTQELKEGRLVTLDAFQQQVRDICEELNTVANEDKAFFADKLQILAEILRDFEVDLRARQAEINFELMSLNAKQKALKLYEGANYSAKQTEKKDEK